MTTTTVTIPVPLGGTGITYRSDAGAYGMQSSNGYGYSTYMMPMLAEVIAACQVAATSAASATAAADVNGTSASTRTPAIGSMTFVYVETGKLPAAGQWMSASSRADLDTNYATGQVTAWDAGTRTVTINVTRIGAAPASASDWNLTLEGRPGPAAELRNPVQARASNSTITPADTANLLRCTAAITLAPDSAAALANGHANAIAAEGGDVTITGVGTAPRGAFSLFYSDGTTRRLYNLQPHVGVLHVRDVKTQGTAGGTATATTWTDRALQTVVLNEISGASLATNEITLPAGDYEYHITSTFHATGASRIELRNTADSTSVHGSSLVLPAGTSGQATLMGKMKLTAGKTFKLRYYVATSNGTSDLGSAANVSSVSEVYSDVLIRKVG